MTTMKIKIGDATNAQLYEAGVLMGLEVKPGMNNSQIRARIDSAQPGITEIEVTETQSHSGSQQQDDGTDIADVGVQGRMVGSSYRDDPKVRIMIPSVESEGGDREVDVGVNGVAFRIQRNEPVDVPYRVFEALNNSEQTDFYQRPNPLNPMQPILVANKRHGYPFQVLSMPSAHEIAAFEERTRDVQGA